MLINHSWLRDWVAPKLDAAALAECLTLGGLEVASVTAAGPKLTKVIVGEIVQRAPHPTRPKLAVCEINTGARRISVVCGAANAAAGVKTAVAMPGAKLPCAKISKSVIGGVASGGMLCSAAELGLEEQSDGVMLFDAAAPIGAAVDEYLNLSDKVFELELTPNRGDCLGVLGLAREISALTGATLKSGAVKKIPAQTRIRLPVKLNAPRDCPRYAGRAVCGINMRARTPDWMAERLRRGGMRCINIVVDITNYVMLELGQPIHAFDFDKIAGGIIVRKAKRGEKLRLLDDRTITLGGDDVVIADHRKAIALAGVMGGGNSAINDATRNVYFEAAFFPAATVRGCARRFGMHTDAAHRFERGVDPNMQTDAIERATRLLLEFAGGEAGALTDARAPSFPPRAVNITFDCDEIPRLLGITLPPPRVRALLESLGMRVKKLNGKPAGKSIWKVRIPGWRSDISGAHDLVEEVARVHGFAHVPPRAPSSSVRVGRHIETRIDARRIKQKLIERGYFEAITYSFVEPRAQRLLTGGGGIALHNPLADNMSVMRRSLWPGLLAALQTNLNRRHERVRLFETGAVFPQRAREVQRIAAIASGATLPLQWGAESRAIDFFDLKGDLETLLAFAPHDFEFRAGEHPALHPGQCAQIFRGRECVGHLGQLHPQHQLAYQLEQPAYLFELDMEVLTRARLPHFSAVSRYPAARRDLAIEAAHDIRARDVLNLARAAAGDLLVDLELFDIYQGARLDAGKKSFAFRLTFQSESSNLTAGEVDAKLDNIIQVLRRELGARLRA